MERRRVMTSRFERSSSGDGEQMTMKTQPTNFEPLPARAGSVTVYRLVLSHADWPRETRTKWQESPDFTKALAKAKELGVTTKVESQIVSDGATTADNGWAGFGSQNRLAMASADENLTR